MGAAKYGRESKSIRRDAGEMRIGSFHERLMKLETRRDAVRKREKGKKKKYRDFTPRRFAKKIEGFAGVDPRSCPRIPVFQQERLEISNRGRVVSQISSLGYTICFEESRLLHCSYSV
jgi:hypothetical protein